MKKNTRSLTSKTSLVRRRGAGMVEYALLLVAVLCLGAVAFKQLGGKVATGAEAASQKF